MRHGNRLPRSAVELATLYRRTAAQSGKRGWYCDRSGCKRSWSDADPIVASVISPDVGEHSVLSVAANLKQQALYALQNVGGDPKVMLPALKKMLDDKDTGVRMSALQVVWRYGPESIPLIVERFDDKDDNIKQ